MVIHTPPRAPDWLFSSYQAYNPPANAPDEDWFNRAYCEYHQATGLLPPEAPIIREARGVLERAYQDWKRAIDQLWGTTYCCQQDLDESAADEHWEAAHCDEHAACERQEATCCQRLHDECPAHEREEVAHLQRLCNEQRQCLLDKPAGHKCQEAARQEAARAAQCLLEERAALGRQEAMRCQRILNEEAASCQRAAHARQTAAAQIIFLWLCR
jgi:hypothetical protein